MTSTVDHGARSVVRDLLERHGLVPDKGFGQNFLVDRHALRAVADAAAPGPNDTVVEVGPGLGALTQELAARARHVVTIELDARLVPALRETTDRLPNVDIVVGDALRFDHDRVPAASVFASNLPYQVSTAVLAQVLASGRYRRAAILVQREVAERIVATPGTPAYGAFSVLVAHHARARIVRDVSAGCFHPPPKVRSSIVVLDVDRPGDDDAWFTWVRIGFRHRRKTLRNNLLMAGAAVDDVDRSLGVLGLEPGTRAERLGLEAWKTLHESLGPPPAHVDLDPDHT